MFEELVLERLVTGVVAGSIKQSSIFRIIFSNRFDLFIVVGTRKSGEAVGEHFSAAWIQFLTVVLGQFGAEGVDGDNDSTSVGLESEDFTHDVSGGASQSLTECEKSLQVRLVERVSDDFNVHLVQVLFTDAVNEEWSQWRVDKHCIVELSRRGSDMDRLHLLETSKWMALGDELGDRTLVESPGDEQDDVVNHVTVGDEVQESREWLDCVISHMLELNHELFA